LIYTAYFATFFRMLKRHALKVRDLIRLIILISLSKTSPWNWLFFLSCKCVVVRTPCLWTQFNLCQATSVLVGRTWCPTDVYSSSRHDWAWAGHLHSPSQPWPKQVFYFHTHFTGEGLKHKTEPHSATSRPTKENQAASGHGARKWSQSSFLGSPSNSTKLSRRGNPSGPKN
jgi:hypothetical protein